MHLSKDQWLNVDPRLPILYNGSDDVVSIRPDSDLYDDEDAILILPGYVLQVNAREGYLLRIAEDGHVTEYLLMETAEELRNFNAGPLLYALRKELTEIAIPTNN